MGQRDLAREVVVQRPCETGSEYAQCGPQPRESGFTWPTQYNGADNNRQHPQCDAPVEVLAEHKPGKQGREYAFDMPGFGRSDGGLEFMTFKAQGEFLKVFLEHFDITNAHLLGPDVGMPAILYYVGTHENTVKSIIFGDGPGIDPSSNAGVIRKMVVTLGGFAPWLPSCAGMTRMK